VKSDLGLYDFLPYLNRPGIKWPDGAQLAFWVAPNIESYELDGPKNPGRTPWPKPPPDLVPYSERDHGNRVGHWRLMDVMDRYGVKGSISLSVALLDHHPEIIEECVKRDWEFYSHGIYNTRYSYNMTEAQEQAILTDSIESVQKHTGQRIRGYLAPALTHTERTMDLLAENDFYYTCDLFHDDQPCPVKVKKGRLISIPYSLEMNDIIAYNQHFVSPRVYTEWLKSNFDRLYAEGADSGTIMCIPLHAYAVGQAHRIAGFEEGLKYITGHKKVWVTTGTEIAEWFYEHHYDEWCNAIDEFQAKHPARV
jgi:peptidoglycan/xylan/chitin deacetylase (PgdA/CDA1 family)